LTIHFSLLQLFDHNFRATGGVVVNLTIAGDIGLARIP